MTSREWTQHILLRSLCSRKRDNINREIISELRPEWITSERYYHALKIVKDYFIENNSFISWRALVKSPKLSEKNSKYIRAKEIKRVNMVKEDESLLLPSSASEYKDFFKRVQHDAKHFKLIELSNQLSSDLSEEMKEEQLEELLDMITTATTFCNTLKTSRGEMFNVSPDTVKKKLKEFYKDLKNHFFLPTGFKDFDEINLGIPLDSLFVIGGQTGSGKTALALSICINAKKKFGARVCFVPLEMSVEMMLLRLGSFLLKVPVNQIVKNLRKHYKPIMREITSFVSEDKEACFDFYVPDMEDTLPDILLHLQNYQYDVICVDYPKLLSPGNMKEHEALDKGAAFAKRWSSKNKCLVMHLDQLDKQTEDIRYSRAVLEHASNAFFIKNNSDFIKENGYVTITQPKARNQSPHNFKLKADLSCSYFGDYVYEDEEPEQTQTNKRNRKKPLHKGFDQNKAADVPDDD